MRKSPAILAAFIIFSASAGSAAEQATRPSRLETNLRVNRMLLARYAGELGSLRRQQRTILSETAQKRITGLRVKIRALKEDAERLKSRRPMTAQADAFLSGFIKRRGEPARPKKEAPVPQLPENDRLHEEALQMVAVRNYPEAVKRYEAIVINDPDDDQAYLLMGHVCLMLGQYDRSEFAYYNAVHINRQNYDEIIQFYQNMILQNSNDDQAYQFLGYAYVILGDAERAKDAYQEALRINPANFEAQKGLSLLAQRFGV